MSFLRNWWGSNPRSAPFKKGTEIFSAYIGRRSVSSKGIDRPALFAFPGKRNTPSACFQNRQNQKGLHTFQRKKLPLY